MAAKNRGTLVREININDGLVKKKHFSKRKVLFLLVKLKFDEFLNELKTLLFPHFCLKLYFCALKYSLTL